MLYYCFTLHVLIQPSQRPQGYANNQTKCVHSRVKALKNITYSFKREFLNNFKIKNALGNVSRDWFWFSFSLVDKLEPDFLTSH